MYRKIFLAAGLALCLGACAPGTRPPHPPKPRLKAPPPPPGAQLDAPVFGQKAMLYFA
jgi:hypothetical protein